MYVCHTDLKNYFNGLAEIRDNLFQKKLLYTNIFGAMYDALPAGNVVIQNFEDLFRNCSNGFAENWYAYSYNFVITVLETVILGFWYAQIIGDDLQD